ncbi:ribokinase [Salinicoccus sp. ID82-1]|uniref:Ribokinase n=1 Tax=Salinicoccus cyprini TaxID=2493691 RepID=A0A558AYD9_9STAP|nr:MULTISPECIES: ribokinase [Salinicoccus]MCG1008803.1 ribokinase [Salinicoccus sp. ID82-1]TVT29282.1 ribokinase [Salinicoccus cyprini]
MGNPKITVIGSINMDLVTVADEMPAQGETIRGESFKTLPGGKGANQAVAAARLGAEVHMIGKVGNDPFGYTLQENLESQGVDTQSVIVEAGISSGLANIIVCDNDNRIIIIAGANNRVDTEYIDRFTKQIQASDYVLIQFEIPQSTIEYILELCSSHSVPVIINPAPAMKLGDKYWEKAAYITPNDHEAEALFGFDGSSLPKFHDKLIITNGAKGAIFYQNGKPVTVPAHKVEVADTTGAGDTFNGALAVALAEGRTVDEAIAFANKAASLSIQKLGAQSGMPERKEVKDY